MKREENPGGNQIITLLVIGAIGYVGYQYLVSSGLWAQWFGGAAPQQPQIQPPATTTVPSGYVPQTTTVPITNPNTTTVTTPVSTVASQLQAMGNQYMANTGAAGLNVDQWLYYYDIVAHGANPANPTSFPLVSSGAANTILAKLGIGIDNTSRAQLVTVQQFLTALGGAGLSGIVRVPNNGPITAPLPTTQNFSGGYGGYGAGGRDRRKGYLN